MVESIKKLFKKSRLAVVGTVLTLSFVTAATVSVVQPSTTTPNAAASSCDPVNIINCGLNGSSASDYIKSYKHFYNTGSDGRYNDIKAVYRWTGATDATVQGMNTSNSKLGTLYRNGDIKVGGKVVGHDAWVSARFGAGRAGFVHVEGNVYARKTTTSLQYDTYKVLVHFNQYGEANYAVMVGCGNGVKFTKVPTKPVLVCDSLKFSLVNEDNRQYAFAASAHAQYTNITSYVFYFGDGTTTTVGTSATTASTSHSYAPSNHGYTAYVVVNSSRKTGVTSPGCKVTFTPPTKQIPALVCDELSFSPVADKTGTYQFVAKATASNTAITSYIFNFNDGQSVTVNTANTSASASHTFASTNKEMAATVTVNSTDVKNVTSAKCKVVIPVKPVKVNECKPGVPVGSVECTPPHVLANTGPGNILGFFGATTIAGALVHRFLLRRRVA